MEDSKYLHLYPKKAIVLISLENVERQGNISSPLEEFQITLN